MLPRLVLVGASGMVGREVLAVLKNYTQNFKQKDVKYPQFDILLDRSNLATFEFKPGDLVVFATPEEVSAKHCLRAKLSGAFVIDSSSHFRMQVPLIMPLVNIHLAVEAYQQARKANIGAIISTSNCIVSPLVATLARLENVEELFISTYQSVSGAGKKMLDAWRSMQLANHSNATLNNPLNSQFLRTQPKENAYYNNVVPYIGSFDEDQLEASFSSEEKKIIQETHKILGNNLLIHVTCVRVSVDQGHSISAHLKFSRNSYSKAPLQQLKDFDKRFFTIKHLATIKEVTNQDKIFITRLHQSSQDSLSFFLMSDNLRRGAALDIVELLLELLSCCN